MIRRIISIITLSLSVLVQLLLCPAPFPGAGPCPLAWAQQGDADDRIVVEGEGEAAIVNQDFMAARQEALESAKRNAFSAALLASLPEPLALSEQERLLHELAPRINEFLIQYRFEELPAAGLMFVSVEAAFSRSSLHEEFRKRGLFQVRGDVRGEPEELLLSIHGIRSLRTYGALLKELPRRIDRIRSMTPYEVFGDRLTLKVLFQGDPASLERAARDALLDMAPWGEERDMALSVSVAPLPPAGSPAQPAADAGPLPPGNPEVAGPAR